MEFVARPRNPVLEQELIAAGYSPIAAQLYASRTDEYIEPVLANMLSPSELKNIDQAVKILAQHIMLRKHILIISDYDADGATGCAVAYLGLSKFGANVSYLIPDRMIHGYGLTPSIVDEARDFRPDLILTIDNGISSVDGVARAKSYGIPVLVTDHHLAPKTLPDALCIVNPNQHDCPFPSKHICGCGVMFYVLIALRRYLMEKKILQEKPSLEDLLPIVAIGTVADVVKLDANNRILVTQGLQRIREGRINVGLKALFDILNKQWKHCTTQDIAFGIAPNINAAGRLIHMRTGIELLVTTDKARADTLASELKAINEKRKEKEKEMLKAAEHSFDDVDDHKGICVIGDSTTFHAGVIGIVASRIKEQFFKPTIVFAEEETCFKGSGRSIPALHLKDVLTELDTRYPGLLMKYGGHAMAAGMSIAKDKMQEFRARFLQLCDEKLTDTDLLQVIEFDEVSEHGDLSLEMVSDIEKLPFGQGFLAPLFKETFEVKGLKLMQDKHMRLTLASPTTEYVAVMFNKVLPLNIGDRVTTYFCPTINRSMGKSSVQLLVQHIA